MKRNIIFILITLVYIFLMRDCYYDVNLISVTNMLLMTLMYMAFIIALIIVNSNKEKQN
jgi:hypothetical protein